MARLRCSHEPISTAPIELTLTAVGVEVRSRGFRGDSSGRRALDEARRISSPSALRSWAHDILDDDAGALGGDESGPAETVSSRQVAAVALEYLREQPDGTGATFASWMTTADPFGFQQGGGVEVLTFHAAKGREWKRVWIAATETGSVPHRSATTKEETLEEGGCSMLRSLEPPANAIFRGQSGAMDTDDR